MAEEMVKQWLKQNDDGTFVVLWSDPPGKGDKAAQAQATHIITIPDSEAVKEGGTYPAIPEAAELQ